MTVPRGLWELEAESREQGSEMAATAEEEYVRTSTGDLVFKSAHVHGSQNLYLKGKVRSTEERCWSEVESRP